MIAPKPPGTLHICGGSTANKYVGFGAGSIIGRQNGAVDFQLCGRRIKIEEGLDVSAHASSLALSGPIISF
jgi:hypothetical protein